MADDYTMGELAAVDRLDNPTVPEVAPDTLSAIVTSLTDPFRKLTQAHMAEYQPGVSVQDMPQTMQALPEVAMQTIGSPAAVGGVPGMGMGIRAYHGSPHDFDKFDLSKIGTGEGAQAYGHGLYFAENPFVAQMYKDNLSKPSFTETGSGAPVSSDLGRILEDAYNEAMSVHGVRSPSGNDAVFLAGKQLERNRAAALKSNDFEWFNKISDQQAELTRMGKDAPKPFGRMYEVNINAEPSQFLDWDKTLSQQNPAVQSAIEPLLGSSTDPPNRLVSRDWWRKDPMTMSGEEIYRKLSRTGGPIGSAFSDRLGSETLREAGIPGVKYLDQGSRAAGQGTNNYAVWNDKIIDILKKYGIPGAIGAGAMGELAAPDQYEAQQ